MSTGPRIPAGFRSASRGGIGVLVAVLACCGLKLVLLGGGISAIAAWSGSLHVLPVAVLVAVVVVVIARLVHRRRRARRLCGTDGDIAIATPAVRVATERSRRGSDRDRPSP